MASEWTIQEVQAGEFGKFFEVQMQDPLARFVHAPVPFPRLFLHAYRNPLISGAKPVARVCGAQSLGKDIAIGFFSGDPDAFSALSEQIENWGRGRGASRVIGPMIYNTWFPYRARLFDEESSRIGVEGFQSFVWEPSHKRGDEKLWEESGYAEIEKYSSRAYSDLQGYQERLQPALEKALSEGFTIHSFGQLMMDEKSRDGLLDDLYQLTMQSFGDAFLFQPIPREYFRQLYLAGFSDLKDLSASFLMRDRDGNPAAFSFAFPDSSYMVFKTLAVGTAYRGKRLSNAVMAASADVGLSQGLDKMIHALMRRGNLSEHFGGNSELLFEHCYGLFAKSIVSQ